MLLLPFYPNSDLNCIHSSVRNVYLVLQEAQYLIGCIPLEKKQQTNCNIPLSVIIKAFPYLFIGETSF